MYLHIRHAHDDGEYYSSKSENETTEKAATVWRPLFFLPSFASERERKREREEREYNFRVYFLYVKTSSDKIERTIKTLHTRILERTSVPPPFVHKNNARTPIIIIIIREGGGVLKTETAPNCHVTTTTTRLFLSTFFDHAHVKNDACKIDQNNKRGGKKKKTRPRAVKDDDGDKKKNIKEASLDI